MVIEETESFEVLLDVSNVPKFQYYSQLLDGFNYVYKIPLFGQQRRDNDIHNPG
jgi:hypothetical protein